MLSKLIEKLSQKIANVEAGKPVTVQDVKYAFSGTIAQAWHTYLVKGDVFDSGDYGDGETLNLEFKFPIKNPGVIDDLAFPANFRIDKFLTDKEEQKKFLRAIEKQFSDDFRHYQPGGPFSKGSCKASIDNNDNVIIKAHVQFGHDV